MKFAINRFAFVVDQFESVRSVPVHVTKSVRRASIGEQKHNLMDRFWSQGEEIPKHIGIFQVSSRISFLSVNKIREQQRIANEKDRRIVAD